MSRRFISLALFMIPQVPLYGPRCCTSQSPSAAVGLLLGGNACRKRFGSSTGRF
jgi:hypothetical protein